VPRNYRLATTSRERAAALRGFAARRAADDAYYLDTLHDVHAAFLLGLLTIDDAAGLYGVSHSTFYRLVKSLGVSARGSVEAAVRAG